MVRQGTSGQHAAVFWSHALYTCREACIQDFAHSGVSYFRTPYWFPLDTYPLFAFHPGHRLRFIVFFPGLPEGPVDQPCLTLCLCDSWSLSHLGYLYPGTTPVMIKLDHNRSCPLVLIAQVTKAPTIITKVLRSVPGDHSCRGCSGFEQEYKNSLFKTRSI